jgi:nitrate/nitrite-specific signal transduction histidine kinase
MVTKILVVAFILFTGSLQSASAQEATQAAVNEAGHLRMVQLRDQIKSQRERIAQGLVQHKIDADQAKNRLRVLTMVENQMNNISASTNGSMPEEGYEAYNSYLNVNASLID